MQFNNFSTALLSLISLASFTAADSVCVSGANTVPDCCWRDMDACINKLNSIECQGAPSYPPTQTDNFCKVNNVTLEECNADCCSVSQKIGIACP
ncbi:hypothetical protein LZ30DRAFT_736645 [Colletotrichum cereale]|nr:hypothetical protein LZ30DRAFT_736645 [Colletotrichum cereale]